MEGPETLIVDTGILVASLDKRDHWHPWVLEQTRVLRGPLHTCEAVLTEACFLVSLKPAALRQLAAWIESGTLCIDHGSPEMVTRSFELMKTYHDVPMSYADACIVSMAEAVPRARVFTLDADFRIYRLRNRRVIPLLAPFV